MSGTMNVNYVSSMASCYANMSSKQTENKGFSETMEEAVNRANAGKTVGATGTMETGAVARDEMSLEEYKAYITEKIVGYPMHPSLLGDSCSISISDEGFKAMKENLEYEKWVLEQSKGFKGNGMSAGAHSLSGRVCAFCNFGATKESCRCFSWSEGYQNGNGKSIWETESKNSIWKYDGSSAKTEQEKIIQKKAVDKKRQEKELAEEAARKQFQHQRLVQDYWSKKQLDYSQTMNGVSATAVSPASAIASYEANFAVTDLV